MSEWIRVGDRLPESGKHVLVCCEIRPSKKRYVCDGYYAAKHNIAVHYVADDYAYEYDEEADEYFLLEGWYEVIKNWDEYSSIVIEDFVTHWMPLPEPPKEEDALLLHLCYVEKRVAELPEAGPIPARRGRWGRWMYEGDLFYRCTECGKLVRIIGRSHYCPNCGANMQGTGTEPERSRVYGERRREYGDGTESDEGHDPEPRADIGGDGHGASGWV